MINYILNIWKLYISWQYW